MTKLELKTYDEFAEDKTYKIIENLDNEEKLDLYNRYCEENEYYEDIIYENDEYFLKEMFGDDIQKAILSVECGNYKSTDKYVKLDAYGNLQSYYNVKEALDKNALDSELIDFTMQDKEMDLEELYGNYIYDCLEAAQQAMTPKEFKYALEEYITDEMMEKYPEVYEIINNEYLSELSKEKESVLETKDIYDDNKIAVKVGYYYAVVDKEKVVDISLEQTGTKVYPSKDNVEGRVYPLYRGTTFEESQKVDKLFDEIAANMKETNLTDLNDLFYLNNQGLYEIDRDIVTEEKEGYDFDISSFGEQFPNYYEDIYVSNKNLKINGAMQNVAYINKDDELNFSVNLPENEKNKVYEIRDKKEILSNLMEKDIAESKGYCFNPQSEEYTLIKESIDLKKGYEAELILDMKNMELRQNLKYNGVVVNTNKAIKYDSYHDMLRNLPYLLDDNHRDVMLTGYVNEQIQKAKEQSKVKELDDDWER